MIRRKIATSLIAALLLCATLATLVQGRPGDHIWEPIMISPGIHYGNLNSTHTDVYYNFTCYQGHLVNVTVIPPPAPADFDLEVYDAIGRLGYSKKGPGYTENVTIPARVNGYHSIHVSRMEGSGNYTLILDPVNHVPVKPSAPSGNTAGYVYTAYTYTTSTTDQRATPSRTGLTGAMAEATPRLSIPQMPPQARNTNGSIP